MNDQNRNNLMFGVIEGGSFAVGILGNQFSIILKRWLGKSLAWMCLLSQIFCGLSILILASQSHLLIGIGFYWLVGFGISTHDSPHMALLNNEIPADQRSAMLSINSMVSYMGVIIGSLLLGYLADIYSIGLVWSIDGLLLVISAILYIKIESVLKLSRASKQEIQKEEAYV